MPKLVQISCSTPGDDTPDLVVALDEEGQAWRLRWKLRQPHSSNGGSVSYWEPIGTEFADRSAGSVASGNRVASAD